MNTAQKSMRRESDTSDRRNRWNRGRSVARFMVGAALTVPLVLAQAPRAHAQDESPVYVDDSPAAGEAIQRAQDLGAVGNHDEAARVLQTLLDRDGALLVPSAADPEVFVEARRRAHQVLLADEQLLEAYVQLESDTARALIETGDHRRAERTRLLTGPGFDAALRLAQEQLEDARFGAAWVTLSQLDRHPARTGARAQTAAQMVELVARYLSAGPDGSRSQRLWDVAERWAQDAGGAPPDRRADPERPDLGEYVTPYDPATGVETEGVLPTPLSSEQMGETMPDSIQRLAQENASSRKNNTSLILHAVPTIAGDVVYVNDSQNITAFDRFTLSRRWRTSLIGPPLSMNSSSNVGGLEDTSGVAVAEPYAVALTGLSQRGRNSRERLLGALDIETGDVAWSTSLSELGAPEFDEALLRGPVEISEGVVALSLVRSVNRQRLHSVGLIAFDLETGDLRWTRQIASIGIVPWARNPEAAELPLIADGVMYYADRIGVIGAIELDTGRVRWIRKEPRDFNDRLPSPDPWAGNRPILTDDGRLIVLDPDRRRISILDARTGAIIDSAPAIRFGQPRYLLRFGDHIVGVERRQITARHIDDLATDTPSITLAQFPRGGPRGRVVVAGDELMIPFVDGLRLVRLEHQPGQDPEVTIKSIALDNPGHALPAPGQIVTVDDVRVHSYLSWQVADRLLRERMASSPRDAGPAITYADLAYRAGRPEGIIDAVDHAVMTIELDPLAPESERSRRRLFASILDMIEPPTSARTSATLDADLREKLISRMSRVATAPSEQVAYLMAAGRTYESTNRPELAVEKYQEVLASPVLARTVFQESGRRLPAQDEATRRLRRLIRLEGRGVYAAYEEEARRLLAQANAGAEPETFDRIARRYPVSEQAPRAWLAAADRYRERADAQREILSLEEGLAAASETLEPDDPDFGQLAGRLVNALIVMDRLVLAEQKLDRLTARYPTMALRVENRVLDPVSLSERIRERLGERERRPRIGPITGNVHIIEGWTIARPIDETGAARLTDRVMMESISGERGMFKLDHLGSLEPLWTRPNEGELLRIDHRSVYISNTSARTSKTISRIDIETGEPLWITPPFSEVFDGPDPFENIAGGVPEVDTPLQPDAPLADIFAVFDHETMVLVERTGRAAAFDVETGDLLWAHERGASVIKPVHDVTAGAGFVAIGGMRPRPPGVRGEGDGSTFENVVAAYDLRTGDLLFEHIDPDAVRWLRITPEGRLLAGLDASMISFDVFRRDVRWRTDRTPVHDSISAWTLPELAVYRDGLDSLRIIRTEDGIGVADDDPPLQVEGRLDSGFTRANVTPIDDRMLLTTHRGIALFERDGTLAGVDSRRDTSIILMPAVGERYAVTIGRLGVPAGADDEGFNAYDLDVFDLTSVKFAADTVALELGAPPSDIEVIDGKILISAGVVTLVIDAPQTR